LARKFQSGLLLCWLPAIDHPENVIVRNSQRRSLLLEFSQFS
jgi:hypothetical protein